MPAGCGEFDMGAAGVGAHALDVLADNIELLALLMYHVGDVTEQLVQLANRLFDVADLGLALDDERFLEIDLILRCEAQLLLLLELLLLVGLMLRAAGAGSVLIKGGTRGGGGAALFFDGATL